MPNSKILIRFTIVMLITMAAVAVAAEILASGFGIDISSGIAIASLIAPSLDAGINYAKKTGLALDNARMWRLSGLFASINFFVPLLLLVVWLAIAGASVSELISGLASPLVLLTLAVVFGMSVLGARLFLGMGVKNGLKGQEERKG